MLSILVVDDEPEIRDTLASVLRLAVRADVDVAADAEQAMSMTAARCYDVVLADERMSQRNGSDLLRDLKERNYPAACLLMSAYGHEGGGDRLASSAGACGFLPKPISLHVLRGVLDGLSPA